MKNLAIITTHPIQYYAPLFRLLTQRGKINVKVFYTWGEEAKGKIFDPGFGAMRSWDIPLLEGYSYEFVKNISKSPGSSHFGGIVNPDIIERIKVFNADALLVFGWAFNSHLKVVRHFKGIIPVYFRGDSTLLDEAPGFSLKKCARRLFLKWVYRNIDKAFYVGTNNKAYYKVHGLKEKQLVYAPHAIDNDRFDDKDGKYNEAAIQWKKELNISGNAMVVLFAGKLEGKKNPLFLIEAAKLLRQFHFIIIGNGILEDEIKQQAINLKNVTVMPFQNQSMMPIVYRLADIFVLPSHGPGETWGLALNEAMACEKIVVASNKCGGAIDLISEGKNGFVISPNSKAFIYALEKISQDEMLIASGGKMSKEIIRQFSFSHIATEIENQFVHS